MQKKHTKKPFIVFLSTFPPRKCGIATFTRDLSTAFDTLYGSCEDSKIIAMNKDETTGYFYPKNVLSEINEDKREDYVKAAEKINALSQAKIVSIQHEYGIYGGEYGEYVIDFMKKLNKPTVVTMHTVLPGPNDRLKEVTINLAREADMIVVMTRRAKETLIRDYGVSGEKINIVPHGITPLPYTASDPIKKELKLAGKNVITTFGLLSRGKGIEYAIEALPEVVKRFPNTVYLVIGATHPSTLEQDGEAYRNSLVEKAKSLGLGSHVIFYNKYMSQAELLTFLQATDIYMSLPLDPNQAVSGTLSYAMGAGRPVIATKFSQALEDVTPDLGMLVDFKNPGQVRDVLLELLSNDAKRIEMGQKAYFRTRRMEWPNVAVSYMRVFINLAEQLAFYESNLPKIKLRHFIKMTDSFGMFQFAKFTDPDKQWGYTLDDNARALLAMVKYHHRFGGIIALKLIRVYLSYIEYTSSKGSRFHNYVNYDKTFHDERNSQENLDDANARALYALASAAASEDLPFDVRHKAATLFKTNLNLTRTVSSTRAAAFLIKAYDQWLSVEYQVEVKEKLKEYCNFLAEQFEKNSTEDWKWFEGEMTYSNGLLPEALLVGYDRFGDERFYTYAKSAIDFLLCTSFKESICLPVGQNGWFQKGGKKQVYDQQPEEVAALIEALGRIYNLKKEEVYKERMRDAFDWFLGNNVLSQFVYNQETGGCYDGIGESQVNLNQGAESTVVYHLARLCMEELFGK